MSSDGRSAPMAIKMLIGIGMVTMMFAASLTLSEIRWLARSIHATARIVEIRREQMTGTSNRPQSVGYRVIFQFVANDGRTVIVPSNVASSFTSYRVGDESPVDYQSGHPESAQLVRWSDRWLLPTIVFFLSTVLLFIGVVALLIVISNK